MAEEEFVVRTAEQLKPVIAAFRKKRGLTQKELGLKLNLSQNSYSEFERNVERASVRRLVALLAELDVDLVLRDRRTRKTIEVEW